VKVGDCPKVLEKIKFLALAGNRTSIPLFSNPYSSGRIRYLLCEIFYTRIIAGHTSVFSHAERSECIVTGTAVLLLG
jgi:hypothetical protein